jgi:tetratricopeptide (TPR) repeat protein
MTVASSDRKESMMKRHAAWLGVALVVLAICPGMAFGETAEEAFAKGQALLAKGNFQGALNAYSEAVQANRENQEYFQKYALVRRILQMREQLDQEQDPARWQFLAQALHSFYVSQKLYNETLELDRKIHARQNDAASATMLAETLLAMDQNAEAAKTLASLGAEKASTASQTLLGVALTRLGKMDEARQIAKNMALPADATPGLLYTLARLQALTGDKPGAVGNLTRCLESLPSSRQVGFKEHARLCPDFGSLQQSPEFVQALATESKVPESKCSGGRSCAGCPMRGQCPSSQGLGQ